MAPGSALDTTPIASARRRVASRLCNLLDPRDFRQIKNQWQRGLRKLPSTQLAQVIVKTLRAVVAARQDDRVHEIQRALKVLFGNGAHIRHKGRFQVPVGCVGLGVNRACQPHRMCATRDDEFHGYFRTNETDDLLPARRLGSRPRERIAQRIGHLIFKGVHCPSALGKASTSAGTNISSSKCTKSAIRNGTTPRKMRPIDTSFAIP